MYERTRKVTFLARYTENDLPVTAVPLGQSIYYSLTLDKGTVSYGTFHSEKLPMHYTEY